MKTPSIQCLYLGLCLVISCILFAQTPLWAGEYFHIYSFGMPDIIELPNDLYLLQFEETWQKNDAPGAPVLPAMTSKIFIPADEKILSVSVDYGQAVPVEGVYTIQFATTPVPLSFQGTLPSDEATRSIYSASAAYPAIPYIRKGKQMLHGVQIVMTDLFPAVYYPSDGAISYYPQMSVTIKTEESTQIKKTVRYRNILPDNGRISKFIDNKEDFSLSSLSNLSVNNVLTTQTDFVQYQYLVITTEAMRAAFQVLTDHRRSAAGGGYTTHIEAIEDIELNYTGVDLAEKMRNFIIDSYHNHGTQYVVLGGDCDGENPVIPTRGAYATTLSGAVDYNIPADLYFGCLDGTWNYDKDNIWGEKKDGVDGDDIDWLSEVYVGRIAADDATEAANHIDKIIAFETSTVTPFKTLLIGENLNKDPTWGGEWLDWVYRSMNSMPNSKVYDRDWIGNKWTTSQVIDAINSNEYNWINHLGHSDVMNFMRLDNSDVYYLHNNKYFLIYTQGCYPGSMDNRFSNGTYNTLDSISETMTTGYGDRGAFAFIGNSRDGWYYPKSTATPVPGSVDYSPIEAGSNRLHKEFVEAVLVDKHATIGAANQLSKQELDFSQDVYRWIGFSVNLLGDPATPIDTQCNASLPVSIASPKGDFHADINDQEPIHVSAAISEGCGEPVIVTDATVIASFDNGDSDLPLFDDGAHGDGYANDGLYGGYWYPANDHNEVTITVNAAKTDFSSGSNLVKGGLSDYDWIDIPAEDDNLLTEHGSGDGDVFPVNIGFSFRFQEQDYSSLNVDTNGILSFTSTEPVAYVNKPIPDSGDANAMVAVFWDDLKFDYEANSKLLYQTIGIAPNRQFIVTWDKVLHYSFRYYKDASATFQIILYEGSNEIKFQYRDVVFIHDFYDWGSSATVGIENQAGTLGEEYSYNDEKLSNGLTLRFQHDQPAQPKPRTDFLIPIYQLLLK